MSDWQPRRRGTATLAIAAKRCDRCGRAVYMTVNPRDWGSVYCTGCDDPMTTCYCPESREVA